ncbi:hypothetical protein AAFF_G00424850 [Aldrovandia affinis]|uniref:Uncharacterized protein n=1 Tax=Aldrovandia affinis TaxID=143900 RepID=A0AAD7T6Z7_9TELE|nr:hypothetical protein AAFF_G00424850 [Aldrovandia affinis]
MRCQHPARSIILAGPQIRQEPARGVYKLVGGAESLRFALLSLLFLWQQNDSSSGGQLHSTGLTTAGHTKRSLTEWGCGVRVSISRTGGGVFVQLSDSILRQRERSARPCSYPLGCSLRVVAAASAFRRCRSAMATLQNEVAFTAPRT